MLARIRKAAAHTWAYFLREGPLKLLRRIVKEIPYRLRRTKSWWRQHFVGYCIELLGNSWKLDGLRFSLNDPSIARKLKSRFFWGTYENKERRLVRKHLPRDLPVIEGGGSIGVVSCVMNSLLKHPEDHVVIEANPRLIGILTKNRDQNGCKFEIINAAVDQSGKDITFYLHEKFVGGSAQRKTETPVTVPSINIKDILEKKGWKKASLVLDIEGAEIDLIDKEADVLQKLIAVLIVEMHDMISKPSDIVASLSRLVELGFELKERQMDVYVYYNARLS
ncbi:MAG: FkbM family methyltransferase [Patescibacteria group bacterium]